MIDLIYIVHEKSLTKPDHARIRNEMDPFADRSLRSGVKGGPIPNDGGRRVYFKIIPS